MYFKDLGQNRQLGIKPTRGNYEGPAGTAHAGRAPQAGPEADCEAERSRSIWVQRPYDLSVLAEKWGLAPPPEAWRSLGQHLGGCSLCPSLGPRAEETSPPPPGCLGDLEVLLTEKGVRRAPKC